VDFLEKFNDSYQYVMGTDEKANRFFELFYEKFTQRSPEIRQRFAGTNFERQHKMLRVSLNYMINFFVTKKTSEYLDKMASLHGKVEHNILPEMYEDWTSSLMETLMDLYPRYDRTVELSWRVALAPGIEYMKFHYDL